jgi:FtsH-binding integral membrane protein
MSIKYQFFTRPDIQQQPVQYLDMSTADFIAQKTSLLAQGFVVSVDVIYAAAVSQYNSGMIAPLAEFNAASSPVYSVVVWLQSLTAMFFRRDS